MTLLEKSPDHREVDTWIRRLGFDPAAIPSFPVIDPNSLHPDMWPYWESNGRGWGVLGRPNKMTYLYGPPRALSRAVGNPPHAQDPVIRTLTGEETIGTSTTIAVSSSIEGSFFDMVKATVTTSFSQTWTHETKFTDSVQATIRPGRMMWLELKPVMRRIEGNFIHLMNYYLGPWKPVKGAGRFSGTVEAPGLEGGLTHVVAVRDEPYDGTLHEQLQADGKVLARARVSLDGNGVLEIPPGLLPVGDADRTARV
ncbi:hypothetical protein [Streptomyces sp. C184]|uniref:hypothetical protein n=1 Tax=Streptomyces sp. C184 TaxID=3237121 RepID=UPI0034C5E9E7